MAATLAQQFGALWTSNNSPPDVFSFLSQHNGSASDEVLAVLLADQIHRWKTSTPHKVEEYLERLPALASDRKARLQLAVGEFQARQAADTSPSIDEFTSRFTDIRDELRSRLLELAPGRDEQPGRFTTTATFISDRTVGGGQVGRYQLERVLGEGAFGRVYLAYDEELQRQVAIKVPTPERFQKPEDAEQYLTEARTVASLNHPNIVPVYDTGRTQDGSIYVVSKFIEGRTLDDRMKQDRPGHEESARLLAIVAQALHHAHQRRLVHRDVKPGNILLEGADSTPYVADFGLAIREEDYLKDRKLAGTPAYMSPEQARGEGHRLDGRSDIFSLGVVLYELLTGQRPFRGSTANELLHQVITVDPRPPRELDPTIPAELERICLKMLAKRASDRYATASDLADDLRYWPQTVTNVQQSDSQLIVPKGLRSFDADDADFFLDLLPGPRDREGLPESIRFWKTRLEETDADKTFSVGLIYGPSGCGKSSLVKAGLLPRLSQEVVAVYVEATPDDTETRILRGLRKQLPDLPDDLGLVETFTLLRRGTGRKVVIVLDQFEQWLHAHRAEQETDLVNALRQCAGARLQAVVMVRDDFAMAAARFMQELESRIVEGHNFATVDLFDVDHAQKVLIKFGQAFGKLPSQLSKLSDQEREFVGAVTAGLASDGKVVSVRLALFAEMVKGKAWISATLEEVGGTEGIGVNFLEETFVSRSANPNHRLHQVAAREVLKALLPDVGTDIKGHMRSHAELMEASGYGSRPKDFDDLIRILDSEIRLITPTDPEGKDTNEDSVTQSQAGQKYFQLTHDYLVPSLRDWLTRKQRETRRGRAELRLGERAATWNAKPENRYLPSLVEWLNIRTLTDRKRWTEPQRAMIRRADRFHLSRLTAAVVLLGLITASGLWTWHRVDQNRSELLAQKAKEQEATRIEGLVGRLVSAEPNQLPSVIEELDSNSEIAATYLSPLLTQQAQTLDEKRSQLHARLASVARDKSLIDPLLEELLTNKVSYIGPIRQQLRPYAGELSERLWAILRDESAGADRRFRAAAALADYVPESEASSWSNEDLTFVARQLLSANAEFQPLLRENLRPIHGRLLPDLATIFGDPTATDAQRLSAANAFADYAASDIAKLSELLTFATAEQYAVLYPIVAATPATAIIEDLGKIAATLPSDDLGSVERIPFGQRRANAAVTMLRLGEREKVLPVFDWSDDPEALTQFIFRCKPRGLGVEPLLDLLDLVAASADRYPRDTRYALMLAIGEYAPSEIPQARRAVLVDRLADWYANDPSSGVHGAAGWLLRHLGEQEIVTQVNQTPVHYSVDREWFTLAITVTPTAPPKPKTEPTEDPQEGEANAASGAADAATETNEGEEPPTPSLPGTTFYYTFIVFPPGESTIGSPEDEPERFKDDVREKRHRVKLTRPFALLDREITMEELIAFKPMYVGFMQQFKARPDDGGFGADWYDSVAFCRWLGEQMGLPESDQAYGSPESLDKEKYPREPTPSANWAPRDWPLDLDRRGFRLPTDAEWEVATRGGSRTAYGFGGEVVLLERFGWFAENSGKQVHPTKELLPSVRGLFDLHGNVFEWTHDWYKDYSAELEIDPIASEKGSYRLTRGGGWGDGAAVCRTAFRPSDVPSFRASYIGFRLALSPSSQAAAEPGKGAEPAGVGTEGASAEQRP